MKYYVLVNCGNCDAEIHQGPNLTWLEHNGVPVVSAMEVEQERVDCDECGAVMFFGDLDYMLDTENVYEDDESDAESEVGS